MRDVNQGPILGLGPEEAAALLGRVKDRVAPEDYAVIEALVGGVAALHQMIEDKDLSLAKLRQLLFGASTEKTDQVLKAAAGLEENGAAAAPAGAADAPRDRRKGHGRNGAEDYPGAESKVVSHPHLKPGCVCPHCGKGKVYELDPSQVLRIQGRPFLPALLYLLARWRCNLCGEVFTANLPPEAGAKKYDETAGSILALLKYGTGMPFNRLEGFQASLGVPLPAATQWEIALEVAEKAAPAFGALQDEAAQGKLLHNDDTSATVLSLLGAPPDAASGMDPERTGVFTSGIVATTRDNHQAALFRTGRRHAGERLAEVLKRRSPEAGPPIQMCDGLSRNIPTDLPNDFETLLANCLSHGRRKFVEVVPNFPEECRHVLEELRGVYRNDAVAKERKMTPEERLAFHQAESGPIMERLKTWMGAQIAEKKVEPNGGLGKAIAYMLQRWMPLTLFLRVAGAPLDNNICERALKLAILHRKNAYFYKTENGARVGDILMSLIHTCRLNGVNPFLYLTAIQKYADRVQKHPERWLPWNYRVAIDPDDTG